MALPFVLSAERVRYWLRYNFEGEREGQIIITIMTLCACMRVRVCVVIRFYYRRVSIRYDYCRRKTELMKYSNTEPNNISLN